MNPQKDATITKLVLKQYTESKVSLWTLESPMTTLKTENPNILTATNIGMWQRNADQRRKNMKLESVSNMKRKDILQRTTREHSR